MLIYMNLKRTVSVGASKQIYISYIFTYALYISYILYIEY